MLAFGCIPAVLSRPSLSVTLPKRLSGIHRCLTMSHWVPRGQQVSKSGQQSAPGPYLQQPYRCTCQQHLLPAGQRLPSRHRTWNLNYGCLLQLNICLWGLNNLRANFQTQILQRPILSNLSENRYNMEQLTRLRVNIQNEVFTKEFLIGSRLWIGSITSYINTNEMTNHLTFGAN